MNAFVEENKGLLRKCYLCANVMGWFLLILGCLSVVGNIIALGSRIGHWEVFIEYFFNGVPWNTVNCLPNGLLALGIAQFIKFISDKNCQPGNILSNADKLLYTYAILFAVSVIIHFTAWFTSWEGWSEIIARSLAHIIFGVGKTMLLIAVALILKRIIPVIEESRTLV